MNDPSKKWVERSSRFAMISWLFLGIGIGFGSVWATSCSAGAATGAGMPWKTPACFRGCVALALVHSFTVRKRGAFKRWSIMCACITFAFVITGTFITRSASCNRCTPLRATPCRSCFRRLIAVSMLVGIIGLFIRWKSFCPGENDVMESFALRDAAYYFNNVIMIVFTVILPPHGGKRAAFVAAVWRPEPVCWHVQRHRAPAWRGVLRDHRCVPAAFLGETDPKTFWKKARIPALCAVVLFVGLCRISRPPVPAYDAIIQAGGTEAEELAEGPGLVLQRLRVVGFRG